jgi:hypothetical protein
VVARVSVADIAGLVLSGAALGVAGVALRVSRRQLVIDARALDLAERQLAIDERQHEAFERAQAARPDLKLEVRFHDADASDVVHREHDVRTAITVIVRNDGDADALAVHVEVLAPVAPVRRFEWNQTLRGVAAGIPETRAEPASALFDPVTNGSLTTSRNEQVIERVYAHSSKELYGRMILNRGEYLPVSFTAWSESAPHDVARQDRRIRHSAPPLT